MDREKAEGNLATVRREVQARKAPNYDAACFHAQQCIEKYLKARLQEAEIHFGRTHDLVALLHLLLPVEPSWEPLRPNLHTLTTFAVGVRYRPRVFVREQNGVVPLPGHRAYRCLARRGTFFSARY